MTAIEQATPGVVRGGRTMTLDDLLRRFGLVFVFVAVAILFSVLPSTRDIFPTQVNIVTILGNQTVGLVIAMACVVPLTAGILDLSVGAIAGAASITTAAAMSRWEQPLMVAIALGMVVGVLIGVVNGWIITRFALDPIIETLAMSMLIGGLMVWYTGGSPITGNFDKSFQDFGSLNWLGVPRMMVVLVPVILVAWYLTEHTPFGRGLAAIGSNARAASLVGIRVGRSIWASLVASGFLAGLAGVLLTARAGSADVQTGPSFLFPALAAVFLGATAIKPGVPNVFGAVIGGLFVAAAVSGLSIAGAASWAPGVFNGAALLLAVWMMATFNKRRTTR